MKARFKVQGSKLRDSLSASSKGFTLVELLVSSGIILIAMAVIYSVFRVQAHSVKAQENRLEAQEYAREVLDIIVREIRNAGYNPTATTAGANCAGGAAGAPGIVTATATSLRFTADFQGNPGPPPGPDGDCDDANEDITYAFAAGNITRAADGGAQNLTDGNATGLEFKYFRQDGTEINPVTAADLPNIRRVLITLTIQSKNPDPVFGGQLNATMISNAHLRNQGL